MILHLAGDKLCCTKLSLTLFLQTVIARCTFFPVDLGIFCSQYKQGEWYSRLGGDAIAEAVIDRIVHNCTVIYSGDVNMREYTLSSNQ